MSSRAAHAFAEREGALVDHLADDSLEHAADRGPQIGVGAGGWVRVRIGVRRSVGIARVVVVAAPALAAVQAGGDVAGGDRGRAPARLAEALLVEALGDLQARVDPDEVHQLEGTHAKAALDAHDPVDRLDVRDSLLQQSQRLEPERPVAAVDEEARAIVGADHRLAHRLARRVGEREGLLRGLLAGDHLQQAHDRRGVEEVHAHHALWTPGARGDRRDQQRRGVCCQHALLAHDLRQLPIQVVLEIQALGHGLDHQLAWRERGQVIDGLQPLDAGLSLLLRQTSLRGFFLKTVPRPLEPSL